MRLVSHLPSCRLLQVRLCPRLLARSSLSAHLNVMSLSGALKKVSMSTGSCRKVIFWVAKFSVNTSPYCNTAQSTLIGKMSESLTSAVLVQHKAKVIYLLAALVDVDKTKAPKCDSITQQRKPWRGISWIRATSFS